MFVIFCKSGVGKCYELDKFIILGKYLQVKAMSQLLNMILGKYNIELLVLLTFRVQTLKDIIKPMLFNPFKKNYLPPKKEEAHA